MFFIVAFRLSEKRNIDGSFFRKAFIYVNEDQSFIVQRLI